MTIRKLYWLAHHFFSICCVHFSLLPGSLVQLHILSSPQKCARNPAYTPKYKKKADFISSLLWEWVHFTASLHITCNSSAQVSVWAQNGTIKSTFLMRESGKVTKWQDDEDGGRGRSSAHRPSSSASLGIFFPDTPTAITSITVRNKV